MTARWNSLLVLCAGGLALLAMTAFAPAAAGPLAPEAAAAQTPAQAQKCIWKKHTRRVVRWVRRDGERRRVVRVKRYWRCHPVASPLVPVPLPIPVDPLPEPLGPARLSVRAAEFSYTLSRPVIAAGDAIIELDNRGEDPHNLNLARTGSADSPLTIPEIGPLTQTSGRFSLSPGTYRLWCSLPLHEEWGMIADLTVSG